jgi:hypothetical protein
MNGNMDKDPCAAARFYRAIRDFSVQAKPWSTNAIWYETRPDESLDFTLVSQRVYGRRDEFLAVMAAAGIDSFDQAMPQQKIALPKETALHRIKRQTGFESQSDYREDFAPVWAL